MQPYNEPWLTSTTARSTGRRTLLQMRQNGLDHIRVGNVRYHRRKMVATPFLSSVGVGVGLRRALRGHFGLTRTTPKSQKIATMVYDLTAASKQANFGNHQRRSVAEPGLTN
jgi:hypothetical protein